MHNRLSKRIAMMVLGAMLVGFMAGDQRTATYATNQGDVDQAQNEVDKKQAEVDKLKNELSNIHGNISDTKNYITELDNMYADYSNQLTQVLNQVNNKQSEVDAKQAQLDAKIQEIDKKQLEIKDKKKEIKRTKKQLADAKENQEEQYKALALRIQYMYECGEDTFLDLIFSSEDFADMLGRTEYVSSITEYDRKKLQEMIDIKNDIADILVHLKAEEKSLEDEEAKLEEEKKALEKERNDLKDQQNQLEGLKNDLSYQQTYVNTILGEKQQSLSEMEGDEASTAARLELAQHELNEQKAFAEQIRKRYEEEKKAAEQAGKDTTQVTTETLQDIYDNGGFTWPLPGYPFSGMAGSEYGYRTHPITGAWALHDGTDISGGGVDGKPIVAAYSGKVILSEYYYGYGNTVQISHGAGVVTQYSHCSSLAVSVGDYVSAGQTIAYVGATGNATGPHLHFGMYIEGSSVDAMNYVTYH